VERAALTLPADAMGAHFLDTDLGSEFFWDGTAWVEHAGGGGASTFLDLLDTPDSYADAGLFLARVNAAEDALEFSTDLPDHVHSADEGQGGILDHGALDGLDDHDHPLYIPIGGVSRLRAGVVTVYADPDNAFAAADTAGDVVLVPPGTWVLSSGHSLAAGVSLFGLGPAEACILSANLSDESYVIDLATGAGVVQNVKIVATMTRNNNGILTGLSLGPGTTARNVISIVTASGSTYTIYGAGICTNGNVWVIGCKAYLYISGSTIEGYAYYHFGGYIFHSYGYAEKTSGDSAVVAGLYMITSTTAYTFESTFEAGGAIGSRYGIYAAYGTNYVFVSFASGATYDLVILYPATLVIYSLKYNTLNNAGTLSQYGGDRAGTNRADTILGLWTFDRGAATAPFAIARADAPTVTNLDADKLDAYEASAFPRKAEAATIAGKWTFNDDILMAGTKDIYPRAGLMGVGLRSADHCNVWSQHWDVSSMPAGWAWAGAPFITPPTVSFGMASHLSVSGFTVNPSRAFLVSPFTPLGSPMKASVGLALVTVDCFIGIRMDDGTDNNYFEMLLRHANAAPAQWDILCRYRLGGGAVTDSPAAGSRPLLVYPQPVILYMSVNGTMWSSWTISCMIQGLLNAGASTFWVTSGTPGSNQTWTPTRKGLVFYQPSTVSWYSYRCDSWYEA
jgi:hypothetical protein